MSAEIYDPPLNRWRISRRQRLALKRRREEMALLGACLDRLARQDRPAETPPELDLPLYRLAEQEPARSRETGGSLPSGVDRRGGRRLPPRPLERTDMTTQRRERPAMPTTSGETLLRILPLDPVERDLLAELARLRRQMETACLCHAGNVVEKVRRRIEEVEVALRGHTRAPKADSPARVSVLRDVWREGLKQCRDPLAVGPKIKPALIRLEEMADTADGDVMAVLAEWWQQVALTYHPDRGGDTAAMQALNAIHDRLRHWLFEEVG